MEPTITRKEITTLDGGKFIDFIIDGGKIAGLVHASSAGAKFGAYVYYGLRGGEAWIGRFKFQSNAESAVKDEIRRRYKAMTAGSLLAGVTEETSSGGWVDVYQGNRRIGWVGNHTVGDGYFASIVDDLSSISFGRSIVQHTTQEAALAALRAAISEKYGAKKEEPMNTYEFLSPYVRDAHAGKTEVTAHLRSDELETIRRMRGVLAHLCNAGGINDGGSRVSKDDVSYLLSVARSYAKVLRATNIAPSADVVESRANAISGRLSNGVAA